MSSKALVIVAALSVVCLAQRSSYAGRRPIGYPEMDTTTTTESALGNRFGEDGQTTTTERLPVEANGDRDLVNRLNKMPVDKQPFWFLNWKALEEHRKKPVSYELRPSPFLNQNPQPEPVLQRRMQPEPVLQRQQQQQQQQQQQSMQSEPKVQGRHLDFRGQDRRLITNPPPTKWQEFGDDLSSMDDSSAMFFY